MSILRQCLDDYRSVRRSVGFKLVREAYLLANFIRFLEREGAATVTTQFAIEWAEPVKQYETLSETV